MRIIFLVAIVALTACNRAIGEDGSNASDDAQQLGAIEASDHAGVMGATAAAQSPVERHYCDASPSGAACLPASWQHA